MRPDSPRGRPCDGRWFPRSARPPVRPRGLGRCMDGLTLATVPERTRRSSPRCHTVNAACVQCLMGAMRAGAAATGASIGGLRCATGNSRRVGAHVELFAHRHVVVVAAGIGMAPPVRTRGAYVTAARCSYPVRTREPTGLLELEPSARALTLGEL